MSPASCEIPSASSGPHPDHPSLAFATSDGRTGRMSDPRTQPCACQGCGVTHFSVMATRAFDRATQGVDARPKAGHDEAEAVHPASCPHLVRAPTPFVSTDTRKEGVDARPKAGYDATSLRGARHHAFSYPPCRSTKKPPSLSRVSAPCIAPATQRAFGP